METSQPLRPAPNSLVDVHAHFVPEPYRAGLLAAGKDRPDGSPIPPWSAAAHLERLDELGIETAMLSLSSPGLDVDGRPEYWARLVNDTGAALVADHPRRFGWLASLPLPDVTASMREMDRVTEASADGFALLTNYAGVYLGDRLLDPVMAELDRRQAVVFIHPTSPAGCSHVDQGRPAPLLEYLFDTTRAVTNLMLNRVLQRFRGIRWIIPHNGAALTSIVDRLQLFSDYVLQATDTVPIRELLSRLYFEVGSSAPFPSTAASLVSAVGTERLLLGTDLPYAPPPAVAANLARILAGDLLTGDALAGLLGQNARWLFHRLHHTIAS